MQSTVEPESDRPRPEFSKRLTLRRVDAGLGIVLLVLGLLIVYGSWGLTYSGRAGPGPGLLPRWVGIGLALVGVMLVVSRWRERTAGEEPLQLSDRRGLGRIGLTLLLLVGLALTLQPLGFLLATGAMIFVLLSVLERERLALSAGVAIALPLASYLLFKIWLGVKLPYGLIGF